MHLESAARWLVAATCVCAASAVRWSWPRDEPQEASGQESVRIDNKLHFQDEPSSSINKKRKHRDLLQEFPFIEATDTAGFYNRPQGSGRFPVRVESYNPIHRNRGKVFPVHLNHGTKMIQEKSDGTLDSLPYCKCVTEPDCITRTNAPNSCAPGKHLCCYSPNLTKSKRYPFEYFNEVLDQRLPLLPGKSNLKGPFPPPPDSILDENSDSSHSHVAGVYGAVDGRRPEQIGLLSGHGIIPENIETKNKPVLDGPQGFTGNMGPLRNRIPNPHTGSNAYNEGPIGTVGSSKAIFSPNVNSNFNSADSNNRPIGPSSDDIRGSESAQRGVLVGPGGPTGIIGPYQRPVLVGPGGPTGIIGPGGYGQRPILIGPGGPTGIIGPTNRRPGGSGILVGPGGPTGCVSRKHPKQYLHKTMHGLRDHHQGLSNFGSTDDDEHFYAEYSRR